MKKSILLPLIKFRLHLYIGEEGLKKYNAEVRKNEKPLSKDDVLGVCNQNNIYLESLKHTETILHESIHFIDWLFEYMGCKEESEFKAYIGSYTIGKILKLQEKHCD